MDIEKVGNAIAYLRKRAGLTQKDLADRIGISDKAVSKWERGINLPDSAYLGKLAILLDTDVASLLSGDVIHHDMGWNGLLVLPGGEAGVNTATLVYDKPLVYYLLSYFLLVGIRTIYVACDETDAAYLARTLGNGKSLGIQLYIGGNSETEIQQMIDAMDCSNVMALLGRSFIYGVDQTRFFQRAMADKSRFTVMAVPRKTGSDSLIRFDEDMRIVQFEDNKKVETQYDYHIIPLVFTPKEKISGQICSHLALGELLKSGQTLYTEVLDRGYVELPMNTPDEVADVSAFVRLVQKACGMVIYCVEEIAWRRGMISEEEFIAFGKHEQSGAYHHYISCLCEELRKE